MAFLLIREISHEGENPAVVASIVLSTEHVYLHKNPEMVLLWSPSYKGGHQGPELLNNLPQLPNSQERPVWINYKPDGTHRLSRSYHLFCHSSNWPWGRPENLYNSFLLLAKVCRNHKGKCRGNKIQPTRTPKGLLGKKKNPYGTAFPSTRKPCINCLHLMFLICFMVHDYLLSPGKCAGGAPPTRDCLPEGQGFTLS